MDFSPFQLAHRYVGVKERAGERDHPLIQWWLSLCDGGENLHDETPWCSAFTNGIAWEFALPRSKSLAARSWLRVGAAIALNYARPGWDVVVLARGDGPQPGPEVIAAPGHVGFFGGLIGPTTVQLVSGNQSDAVTLANFPVSRVLGVRRLA